MVRKRARLGEDNDPLTSTDKVLAGFEELSKSTSQEVNFSGSQEVEENTANKTNNPTSQQVKKSTSQQASNSKIRQVRRKKTSPSNTSKQDTREVDKSGSQQDENIESQKVVEKQNSKSTSGQPNKSGSQQDNLVASEEVKQNPKESDKLASQQVNKLVVRKSTFQLSSTILEQLDRLHLELQLELGKVNAPYKEVIVEEAIARLLETAVEKRSGLVEALLERQGQRK